jgi:hypothetical protein
MQENGKKMLKKCKIANCIATDGHYYLHLILNSQVLESIKLHQIAKLH